MQYYTPYQIPRPRLLLIQRPVATIQELFYTDILLPYSELVKRALKGGLTRKQLTNIIIDAQLSETIKPWIRPFDGYYYFLKNE